MIVGSPFADQILSGGGNDVVCGGDGDDAIVGGPAMTGCLATAARTR